MSLNPTLKSILIRTAYIVGSLLLYLLLFNRPFLFWMEWGYYGTESYFNHYTLSGIWQFAIALTIIWLNIRKLAKPIRLSVIGTYLFFFAIIIFWYKVESFPFSFDFISDDSGFSFHRDNYRILRIFYCLGFILLTSILPVFLKSTDASKLAKFGIVWIWTAILILDFAAAMPNIYFTEQQADKLYMGFRKMGTVYKYAPIYAVGTGDYFNVLIPQDSVYTSSEHYLKVYYERHGDLLIQPETRDTIWIEKGGVWANPNRQTIENNTSCQMRWQWQYYAWHKIKGLFCKEENN